LRRNAFEWEAGIESTLHGAHRYEHKRENDLVRVLLAVRRHRVAAARVTNASPVQEK